MNQATLYQQEYFATIQDPVRLANEMQNKIRIWREWASSRGLTNTWKKKLMNYYGASEGGNTSQAVTRGGAEGELSLVKVNDLHSLIQEQLVIVTSQRPAGQAKAINSNIEALKSAKIGTAISEYYMSQVGFEAKFVTATETALLCDEAYMDLFWNKEAGDPIAVDPEKMKPIMSGDCILRTHSPWNVARDPGLTVENQKWFIITYRLNKFDAAASYPQFRDRILACEKEKFPRIPMDDIPDGSDSIHAHLLVHDRTGACPEGRYVLMIGDDIVFDALDENELPALPYRDFPVERISPSDVIDGATGYASSNDILALEEITDALHSIITTNNVNFGGQILVGPQGANINHQDLAKGVRYFELPPDMVDKLIPLQLTKSSPEAYNYINVLNSKKEKAVGSVASSLAQQASQGASGSSMALIQSQSISYNSGIQRSYFRLLSGVMTKLIGVLAVYADTPRVAKIVGKSKSSGLKEFKYTGRDLNSISSIVYEMVNPMSQTIGGKLTYAQDLLKAGMLKNPKQYITVATTGQLDALTEDDEADQMLILEENEALNDGKSVKALVTETHADHIRSHMSVLSSIEAKSNKAIVDITLAHIQEHIDLWMQASIYNPGILMATNQQPLMPPQGMMPPQGGTPQGAGQMVGGGTPPAVQKAEEVNQPNLPNIAGTNQKPTIPGVTDAA